MNSAKAFPVSILLAVILSGLATSWVFNEATHRHMKTEMHAVFQHPAEQVWTTLAASSAPFEVQAPWTSSRNYRPDHPPPVVRGGCFSWTSWIFAFTLALALLFLHLILTKVVCWLYASNGYPKGMEADSKGLNDTWGAIAARSAWAGVIWAPLAGLAWVGWYWFLLAPMPVSYAQAHVEPLGVLGILVGAFLGHIFTIAYFVRKCVRQRMTLLPTECLVCGYSRAGLRTPACPECGTKQPQNAGQALGLSRAVVRATGSRRIWIVRTSQVAIVLYFLAFPRTLLLSMSPLGDHRFQKFVCSVGDPCAFWFLTHIGLNGDGSNSEDVVGNAR